MTEKQEKFIEKLMAEREIGSLHESVEAQTVRAGMADRIPAWQASEFIESLLSCPKKVREVYIPQPKASKGLAKKLRAFAEEHKDRIPEELLNEIRLICGLTKEAYASRMAVLMNAAEGK